MKGLTDIISRVPGSGVRNVAGLKFQMIDLFYIIFQLMKIQLECFQHSAFSRQQVNFRVHNLLTAV